MSKATEPRVDSTLSKGLMILEVLTQKNGSVGVSDLSRKLGLTKSNTFRLLQTLSNLGYVRQEPDRTYSATLKTWQVGRAVVENMNLRSAASAMMNYLSQETQETIYLAVRDGLKVVYIDKVDSPQPIRSWNPVGGAAPLYCVGTGKAMLAAEYVQLRESVRQDLQAFTDLTLTDAESLDADMEATRRRGYAIDRGEFRPNIYSFGAAILLPGGEVVGALGVSAPNVNLQDSDVARFGTLVQHAAAAVTQSLARL